MHSIIKITLLALFLSAANSREIPELSRSVSGYDLMEVLLRNNKLSRAVNSDACFDYYNPILNQISEEYKASYAACVAEAASAKASVDESTLAEREQLAQQAQDAHDSLASCSENADTIQFLQCYESTASDNSKTLYAISNKAADILAKTLEQYRTIEYSEERCTNASDRAYVEKTSQTYDELIACLMGVGTVPPNQPDTTTPAPDTTTSAPDTTTSAPEETTTDAPEETTAEPDTTTSAPEETTAEPEPTTSAPEETTAEPEPTTSAPEETTAEPEPTTSAPEETTAEPEPTTSAPEETTTEGSGESEEKPETEEETEEKTEEETEEKTEEETEEETEEKTEEDTKEETEEENSESKEDSRLPEEDLFELSGDKIRDALEKIKERVRASFRQY